MKLRLRPVLLSGAALAMTASFAGPALAASGPPSSPASVRGDASAWSVVPSPDTAEKLNLLADVSCEPAGTCMAVGNSANLHDQEQTLAELWNGTAWSIVPTKNVAGDQSILNGVSCVSAQHCVAVGDSTTPASNCT